MIHPVDAAPSQLFGDNPTSQIRPGSPDYWIIQKFGNYQPDGHTGIDYPCKAGTPVRAVTDGHVVHVGWLSGSYASNPWWIAPAFAGYCYVVDHDAFIGIYGHCMDGGAKVRVGQRVSEGQVLGPSGNTGASTGDHLHFEVLPDGYVLNSRMYGRIDPATLFTGPLSYAGGPIAQKEWDEMASKEEIKEAFREVAEEGPAGRDLGWFNWFETALPGWNGNVSAAARVAGIDQAVNAMAAELAGLRGALAAATTNPAITPESLTEAFKEAVGEFSITLSNKESK